MTLKLNLKLPSLGKRKTFSRAHRRFPCYMEAKLHLVDSRITLEGMIFEISQGGVLFRQASAYILDRQGADVRVDLPGLRVKGSIVNTRPIGYGIKLFDPFEEEDVQQLAMMHTSPPFKWKDAG